MTTPTQYVYSKEHVWVKEENGQFRLGITQFAQSELGDIVFVELPEVGETIQTGDPFGSLESVKTVSELYAPHLIEALVRMKDSFNSYTLDQLALNGATAAFRDVDYFEEKRQLVIETREWAVEELTKRGFTTLPSGANFVFTTNPNIDAEALYNRLRDRKVLIRYFSDPNISEYVRITIGTREQMEAFFRHLDDLLQLKND